MRRGLRKTIFGVASAIVLSIVTSCIPQRQIVLIRDAKPEETVYTPDKSITEKYILQPNDYLFINVVSQNAKLSAAFNPQSASNISGSNNNRRSEFFYYGLNDSSCIDFPVVGMINLKGCNMTEAKKRIYDAISETLIDFTLTVRLATNNFSVIGEVKNQGDITMPKDQVTMFEAVALAGGFTTYAKRREVKLLRRNQAGEMEVHTIDMTKGDFINSEYYYVYPNDVLYVRPTWFKMFGWGETLSLSLISSALTLWLLILKL